MDFTQIFTLFEKFGIPVVMLGWFVWWTSTNGKATIERQDKLNNAFTTFITSNNNNFQSLFKQNNFMLHALSNLIMGHRDAAKDMIDQAIVDIEETESQTGGDGKC